MLPSTSSCFWYFSYCRTCNFSLIAPLVIFSNSDLWVSLRNCTASTMSWLLKILWFSSRCWQNKSVFPFSQPIIALQNLQTTFILMAHGTSCLSAILFITGNRLLVCQIKKSESLEEPKLNDISVMLMIRITNANATHDQTITSGTKI